MYPFVSNEENEVSLMNNFVFSKIWANFCREMGQLFSLVYFLVWHYAGTVSLLLGDVIMVQIACPLNDIMFVWIRSE
jgi:hypothetical protein